jgi:hypothetical protein
MLNHCYLNAAENYPTFEATKVAGNIYILAGSEEHSSLIIVNFDHPPYPNGHTNDDAVIFLPALM